MGIDRWYYYARLIKFLQVPPGCLRSPGGFFLFEKLNGELFAENFSEKLKWVLMLFRGTSLKVSIIIFSKRQKGNPQNQNNLNILTY